jgi:hypothetical protein
VESLLLRPALTFGDQRHDVADLVLVGMLSGEWPALEQRVARGLGLQSERAQSVSREEVAQLLKRFRYERRLIAAAELTEWLRQRELTLDGLASVLLRKLLRERHAGVRAPAVPAGEIAAVLRAEAICSGALDRCAVALCDWHAAASALEQELPGGDAEAAAALVAAAQADLPSGLPTLGDDELRRRAELLVTLKAASDRFMATGYLDAAVQERALEHRLDWTTVSGIELGFELEGAAREARLHVVHDGSDLAEVARMLSMQPDSRSLELGSAPEAIAPELTIARPGDLVGPWSEDERWRVLQLTERREPEAADEVVRSRARAEVLSELLERLAAGKVVRHAAL